MIMDFTSNIYFEYNTNKRLIKKERNQWNGQKKDTYDAGSISVLEGLEAVRKRPGMYIGSVSRKGLNHLIYEIVDNAVDEHLAGYCSRIHVVLEKDGSCTVEDNGRGIPVDMHAKGISAERLVFTTLHAGGKFDIPHIRQAADFMV